jgi:hypothetical protein
MKRYLRWGLVAAAALLFLGLIWFRFSVDPTLTGLRNIIHYQIVHALGGPRVRESAPLGAIVGTVQDADGNPVEGAVVLVASPLGHTYTDQSDAEGGYRLEDLPPGRYVPVAGKRGYDDALPQTCVAGLCWKEAATVRQGRQSRADPLALAPTDPLSVVVDGSLVVSPTVEVEVGAPFPSRARRTHFSFERAGLRVNDCYLYEPLDGEGPLPTMLLVLPGPVLSWEIVPVPFAARGYSVLAFYPLRGTEIDGDAADILTALEYLRRGRLPSRADPEQLAIVGASFTSIHVYRLLGLSDQVDVALVLGGMSDSFSFRHAVELGTAHTRPPFDQVLMALGFPNTSPELYFRYSAIYHLEGLPPLCLLHGVDDELVPFSQSVQLAAAVEQRGQPYEFYSYPGLKHYFSTRADDATTQQMMQDSLDCLRRGLGGP